MPSVVIGGFTLGAHLQIGTARPDLSLAQRRCAARPIDAVPLLLIAGERDGMATPAQVAATAARITPPCTCLTLRGANHLNWCSGTGDHDRPDLDLPAHLSPASQQAQTLGCLVRFLDALPLPYRRRSVRLLQHHAATTPPARAILARIPGSLSGYSGAGLSSVLASTTRRRPIPRR